MTGATSQTGAAAMMTGARGVDLIVAQVAAMVAGIVTETATVQTAVRDVAAMAVEMAPPRVSVPMTGTVAGMQATVPSGAAMVRALIAQARLAQAAPSQLIRAAAMAGAGLTCRAAREAVPQS